MTSFKYIIILFLFSCSALLKYAAAQEIPHFLEKLTTEEGLTSNTVNDIVQDEQGFLWIATTDGLNRFDGTEVMQYYHNENVNSISHNLVFCLKKLPGNIIAIGTQAGLCFYNNNTRVFQHFYHTQDSVLDVPNNVIIKLELDRRGNLWAISRNCIFIFDAQLKLKKLIPSPFSVTEAVGQRLKFVEKIFPLSDGNVLLYLYNGWHIYFSVTGILSPLKDSHYTKTLQFLTGISLTPANQNFEAFYPAAHVFKVFKQYFLCVKPGADSLLLFNEQGKQLSSCFFPYYKYPYVLWSQQVAMLDSSRLLFLFHNNGLAVVPITWQNNTPVIHTPSAQLFEKQEYYTALLDRQGNWWLATTEEGLQKVSPYKQNFKSNPLISHNAGKPINYDAVYTSRYRDVLWIATYGEGFFEFNLLSGNPKQHKLLKTDNDTWANFVWNVRQVNTDTLWVGTQIGMFWYCISSKRHGRIPGFPGKPAVLDSVAVTTQFVDSHGLTWMGLGKGKGVCCFDNKNRRFTYYPGNTANGYPLRYPTKIAEDRKGNLWFVNDASSVLVYRSGDTGKFQTFLLPPATQKQLNHLSAIWCGDDTTVWLGATTGGLIKLHTSKKSITIYGHDRGLGNSHINSIFEDKRKRLWLVTDGELSCFDQVTETFTNYSVKDGLPVKYPVATFYYDTLDKLLYTGGGGASFHFDPDKMDPNQPAQKTIITAVHVNGKPYMLAENMRVKFKPWQNDITIQYAAIDLTNGPRTKYSYRLIGEDTGWIMAGNQRQINFSRLAPGNYTFMVRASNSSGMWSQETASISFYIRPPFVQTAWFYLLILLAMAGVFYAMYRFRLRQLSRTEQMRSEISRNLHDEVGSALTNISLGSLLAQKQLQNEGSVSRILERIYKDSQNVSESMREIVWSINPKIDTLGEALPRMLRYASELLEAKNIELEADITPEIEQLKLNMQERRDLFLIFKEAINNLAKHSRASHVVIKIQLVGKAFVMIISDNGIGFDTTMAPINNGLRNMQERSKSHGWQLHIQSEPAKGTTITLKA